jgi:hypothetical protein
VIAIEQLAHGVVSHQTRKFAEGGVRPID